MNFNWLLGLLLIPVVVVALNFNERSCVKQSNKTIPNFIFSDVQIFMVTTFPDKIKQLELTIKPTEDFLNSTIDIVVDGHADYCGHFNKFNVVLNEPTNKIKIPALNSQSDRLKIGCNYTISLWLGDYCFYKNYQIPEQKPCQHYVPEDIFDTFPNKLFKNLTIEPIKNNGLKLNISLSPENEFINQSGTIVITSKVEECNHREEYSFKLAETNFLIPRGVLPHSFLQPKCEYMVDFEIDNYQYCVTNNVEIPNYCQEVPWEIKIIDSTLLNDGSFKINWQQETSVDDQKVEKIVYRLEDDPHEIHNQIIVIENNFESNYSILNLTGLNEGTTYNLIGFFENYDECTTTSTVELIVPKNYTKEKLLIFILACFFVFTATTYIFVPSIHTKIAYALKVITGNAKQSPSPETTYVCGPKREEINLNYVPLELENCDEFEFPRHRLDMKEDQNPKSGNFGIVYTARAYGINNTQGYTTVAVKTVKDNAPPDVLKALLEEINTLKKIASYGNHENVVQMLGCCTIQTPPLLILQFVACGDLKGYLSDLRAEWAKRKHRSHFSFSSDESNGIYVSPNHCRSISESSSYTAPSPTKTESTIIYEDGDDSLSNGSPPSSAKIQPALSSKELESFALQIAKGMAFLENAGIVHRDLAARNVLINELKILKISDFGMSKIGNYVQRNMIQQPLRWMAPESIEKFLCTSKSDVWSYAVVLWEIGTLGAFPYDNLQDDSIIERLLYSLKRGIRLSRPEICTDELYSLMLKCWSVDADDRPSFEKIVDYLSGEQKKIYFDFKKLNPAYVFPPTKFTN